MAIRSYRDQATSDIAQELLTRRARLRLPPSLHLPAVRRLVFLDCAGSLGDLANWQSLHLEKLKGDRRGQYSIRINNQYRIRFYWREGNAHAVEIVDYH